MAKRIYWLKNLAVEEVSAVDLAANRHQWKFFKRAGGEENAMKVSGHLRKAVEAPEDAPPNAPAAEDPNAATAPETGVGLLPWMDAVALLTDAFSTDDAPRIAGLMLAKYGEGPNAEIRLPSGLDPIEAAHAVIGEAKKMLSDNPLLRPDGNPGATATKSMLTKAVESVLTEFGFRRKIKKAAPVVEDAEAPAASAAVLAELKTLNGHLAALGAAPATAAKPKGKPAVTADQDEDEEVESGDPDDVGYKADDEEEAVEGEPVSAEVLKGALNDIVTAINVLGDRMTAVETNVAKRARGVSKAQNGGGADGGEARPGQVYSTMLGGYLPAEKVEPFLKRAGAKPGEPATKH